MRKTEKEIFEVFFRTKPAMMLVALRNSNKSRYGSILAKEVDCTYSHAVKILQEMETAKLVEFETTFGPFTGLPFIFPPS